MRTTFLILGICTLLYGCHTMEGMGTDIKEVGRSIEHSAEKNKNDCQCPPSQTRRAH